MKARMAGVAAALCFACLSLAQGPQTDSGVAQNMRGETVNKKPLVNDQQLLNQAPAIRTIQPSVEKKEQPKSGALVAISIGEDRAPTESQRARIRHANAEKIPLGALAREWRKQRDADRAATPNLKRWVIEQQ